MIIMPPTKRKAVTLDDAAGTDAVAAVPKGKGAAKKPRSKKRGKKEVSKSNNGGRDYDDDDHSESDGDNGMLDDEVLIELENEEEQAARENFIIPEPEHCGTLLLCGGANWDMTGRSKAPKGVQLAGRNLYGLHRLEALEGVRIRVVASGNSACHTVIVTEDGRAMTWGRNDKGQLGHGDIKRRDAPTVVEALTEYKIVGAACGRSHTLFLTDRGQVFGCGDNKMGQCGVGSKQPQINEPTKIPLKGRPITKFACGGEFSMIIDYKGCLYSFGCPEYGQLGNNTDGKYFVASNKMAFNCEISPKRVGVYFQKSREGHIVPVEDVVIVSVACGANHTIAMDSKKRCYTWGFGGYGRLGHAEPKDEMVPRLVKFFDGFQRGVKSVHAGGTFCLAVSEHGALFFWGQNKPAGEASMYPKPVQDLTGYNIRYVGCNNRSIVVVTEEGVISWGCSPTFGELGYGEGEHKPKSSAVPKEVHPLDSLFVHHLACGYAHNVYIIRDEKEEEKEKLNKMPVYSI